MHSRGRVKTEIALIENKPRRHKTFGKRKIGVLNKAKQLATLTGTQVLILVAYEEMGQVFEFATDKFQPVFTSEAGKALIQSCLKSQLDSIPPPHHDIEPTDVSAVAAMGFEKMDNVYQVLPESGSRGSAIDESRQSFTSVTSLPGTTVTSSSAQSMLPTTSTMQESSGLQVQHHSQALVSSLPMGGHMLYPSPPPHALIYNISHGPYEFQVSHEELVEFALSMRAADPSL